MSDDAHKPPGPWRWLAVLLASLAGWLPLAAVDARTVAEEYELKAAFLLNFANFTEWPAALVAGRSRFTLCVTGHDRFDEALAGLRFRTVRGQPVVVRWEVPAEALPECDLVFVAGAERRPAAEFWSALREQPVLTVSDAEGFVAAGGMIEMVMVDNRLRFDVNRSALEAAGLKLGARVLGLARRVR